jgi:hypothetical protein
MAAKRVLITVAFAVLAASVGCRSWCERHYPCPQPVACQPCVPCCPTPAGYTPAAAPAPVASWSNPAPLPARPMTCTCVPQ